MLDFESVLQAVADKYGSTPEEVCRNMQEAIDEDFNKFDPAIRAAWKLLPCKGERPTPEEVVMGIAAQLRALEMLN